MTGEALGDRYIIERRLGKQAGRQTLLARDKDTQALVVVKLLTFSNDFNWDDLKLFEREAQTLQTLSHPDIPRYLDSFELDTPSGKGFALVQSYIEAKSLEEHLSSGRTFSEAEAKQLAKALLEILTYLHGRQPPVIHRDIKPSNILLTNRSGSSIGQAYLVDFGSVQTLATQEGRTVTVVGTYGYMPPEQFGGRAVPASDLYSLGATLIALVTGMHPADLPQKDMRIEFEAAAHLSPAFASWLKWLIEPSLERRLISASEALQALEKPKLTNRYPLQVRQKRQVTTLRLMWNSLWRSTIVGTLAVTGYAALYGTFGFPGFGTVFGAFVGGCLGLPLGLLNGLLVGTVTRLFFFPLTHAKRYRRIISFTSTLVCTAASIIIFIPTIFATGPNYQGILFRTKIHDFVYFIGVPAIIAGLSMGAISKSIARWYEQESRRAEEE